MPRARTRQGDAVRDPAARGRVAARHCRGGQSRHLRRNPNLLVWHRNIWLIDHGAALYFHHNWPTADPKRPFDAAEHVLRDRATALGGAHAALAPQVTEDLLPEVTALVPPGWFGDRGADAYVEHLVQRAPIVPEVIRL